MFNYTREVGYTGWGGRCTCPDGSVYWVGDMHNKCGSLACIGGDPGICNKYKGMWSHRKVICGQKITTTTSPTTQTKSNVTSQTKDTNTAFTPKKAIINFTCQTKDYTKPTFTPETLKFTSSPDSRSSSPNTSNPVITVIQ